MTSSTTISWQEFGYLADRSAPDALKEPQGVAVDSSNNVYVVDTYNNQVRLYRWNATSSSFIYDATFASMTRTSAAGKDIRLPRDIAIGPAPDNRIYLLDSGNNRILVADGPDDSSWDVWKEDANWGNPYGMDIVARIDGNITLYLANTDKHNIIQLDAAGNVLRTFGHFGTRTVAGVVEFRSPRDVALGRDGRIYVADTYNHRVVVLNNDATFYRNLGVASMYSLIQKIEVDTQNHVYVIDSDNRSLIYFPGPSIPKPYDAYVRDYIEDLGVEPSGTGLRLSSPDILVRHNPDVDLSIARTTGLSSYAFQSPRYNENNYIYIAVRNRGTRIINNVKANIFGRIPPRG
ncbi:MAG: NHL repeat-containing protein [Acidobacteria bacterium]|nr:NHL repeat-containing protein [Acidobacteriota bacterium]